MDVLKALEIERLDKVKNGIYICTNPENKEFKLINIENVPILINGQEICLINLLKTVLKELNQLKKENIEIANKYNILLSKVKQYIILNELEKIGGSN